MEKARIMTIEEVEDCGQAYLLYDPDDPEVYGFTLMKDEGAWLTFGRMVSAGVFDYPNLWKERYGKNWVAFEKKPDKKTVKELKGKMYG